MKKIFVIYIIILIVLFSCKNKTQSNENINSSEYNQLIENIFNENDTEGTLVIYDVKDDKYIIHNEERFNQRFYPASSHLNF